MSEKKIILLDSSESENKKKEENCYYIKCKHNNKIFKLKENSWKLSKYLSEVIIIIDKNDDYGSLKNPIIISSIKENILEFIVDYINYHSNKKEKVAPPTPLVKIHISEIFGDEYILFKSFINEKKDISENIIYINDFINASLYFGIDELYKKLSAIIAYILSNIDDLSLLHKSFNIS